MRVIIEGPDKTGKSTLAKELSEQLEIPTFRLPEGQIRELVLSEEFTDTASTFLFFADTMRFWNNPPEKYILDRDILSMLVYQGYLKKNMNPIVILNLYKSVVYAVNKPDTIYYLINRPFERYDMDDPFEKLGYVAIREAYEQAVRLVEFNFPEIKVIKVDNGIR